MIFFITTGALLKQENMMKSVLAVALGLVALVAVSGKSLPLSTFA